jgi:hypothetical protein
MIALCIKDKMSLRKAWLGTNNTDATALIKRLVPAAFSTRYRVPFSHEPPPSHLARFIGRIKRTIETESPVFKLLDPTRTVRFSLPVKVL